MTATTPSPLPDSALRNDDGTIEMVLTNPLKIGSEERRTLVFRPLTIADLLVQDQEEGRVAQLATLIARSAGIDLPTLKRVDVCDWDDMQVVVASFFRKERRRGAT